MQENRDTLRVDQLFLKHSEQLQRYLRKRLRNDEDAQEIAQEAYLRLLRVNRDRYIRQPQAYLFRIARNLVHELYTGISVDPLINADELDALVAMDPTLEESADNACRLRCIERAVNELPIKCQTVVLLSWQEGLTQHEISEQLDISRSMVQKYLANGLAHCRKRLVRLRD